MPVSWFIWRFVWPCSPCFIRIGMRIQKIFLTAYKFCVLKGLSHRIFNFRFFPESVYPRPLISHSRPLESFENSRRSSLLKVDYLCQGHRRWIYRCFRWHRWQYSVADISSIFRKNRKDPKSILRCLGQTDALKNLKIKTSCFCAFIGVKWEPVWGLSFIPWLFLWVCTVQALVFKSTSVHGHKKSV